MIQKMKLNTKDLAKALQEIDKLTIDVMTI